MNAPRFLPAAAARGAACRRAAPAGGEAVGPAVRAGEAAGYRRTASRRGRGRLSRRRCWSIGWTWIPRASWSSPGPGSRSATSTGSSSGGRWQDLCRAGRGRGRGGERADRPAADLRLAEPAAADGVRRRQAFGDRLAGDRRARPGRRGCASAADRAEPPAPGPPRRAGASDPRRSLLRGARGFRGGGPDAAPCRDTGFRHPDGGACVKFESRVPF